MNTKVNMKVLVGGILLLIGVAICFDAAHVPNTYSVVVTMTAAVVIIVVASRFGTRRGR